MASDMKVCIGIDVGGTNTDAVALCDGKVIAKSKTSTTASITIGIQKALRSVLKHIAENFTDRNVCICRVNIGTTHFLNAVLQRKNLAAVAVVRLCGPASKALPPFCDFPEDLRAVISSGYYLIDGGYEFNGEEIEAVNSEEVHEVIAQMKRKGEKHIVVSGIFSSICVEQELAVGEMIKSEYPEASLTLSHEVANHGLLARENSSILNECLKPLSKTAIAGFTQAIKDAGLKCPVFFTQNDGTIISAEKSSHFPVLTFSSGPTNSMRGAAFLSQNKDAIVVDIGGTTTDVGVLINGFPRPASTRVKCGGVVTNFHMPDVLSIALGGGSIVSCEGTKPVIGPKSVGYELTTKSLVYGGSIPTTTDYAVAAGLCSIGDTSRVAHLHSSFVSSVVLNIRKLLEECIDQVKIKPEPQPVILVGGGSVLVDVTQCLQGASTVMKPDHYEVANAVGAALSKVSGTVDHVVDVSKITRDKAFESAQSLAIARAINNYALPESVAIVEKSQTQLQYLKGEATRIQVKAVGDLAIDNITDQFLWHNQPPTTLQEDNESEVYSKTIDHGELLPKTERQEENFQKTVTIKDATPFVEESTGAWILNEYDVECIAIGAGILGCGGGGNPYLAKLRAGSTLKSGMEMRVIHPDSVPKNGLILPVAFMGAPSVHVEKLTSGSELQVAAEKMQELLNCNEEGIVLADSVREVDIQSNTISDRKKIVALLCCEIGGMNSIEPLILGAQLGLPVVDCDGMGRAFPELNMFIPYIHGLPPCPAVIVGSKNNSETVTYAETAKHLENKLREMVVSKMGCFAGLACPPLTAEDLRENTVRFSMSRGWLLGNAVKVAQKEKRCPVKAVLESQNGKLLIAGKIVDVERRTDGGFNKGIVRLEGLAEFSGFKLDVLFQNENIVVQQCTASLQKKAIATVPDLISILDTETAEVIPTEEVRYGLRVSVIVLPCPPLLCSDRALKVVGPEAFGYKDCVYQPCGLYKESDSIPVNRS